MDLTDLINEKLSQTSDSVPSTYWKTGVNIIRPGWEFIGVPSAGNLWVYYDYIVPAAEIFVHHVDGTNTPINRFENNIKVSKDDSIQYRLNNPASDAIALAYQIT